MFEKFPPTNILAPSPDKAMASTDVIVPPDPGFHDVAVPSDKLISAILALVCPPITENIPPTYIVLFVDKTIVFTEVIVPPEPGSHAFTVLVLRFIEAILLRETASIKLKLPPRKRLPEYTETEPT
jgi:hypothetical protein